MVQLRERLITDEIKKLVPVLGKETANNLLKTFLLADEDTRERIFLMVDTLKAAVFTDKDLRETVLMEPPDIELASRGHFKMGQILYGKKSLYPLMFDVKNLLTHVGIFGSSGYGKTNIAYNLITNISDLGIPVLVFDFSKRNYKDLLATELKERIRVYTVGKNTAPLRFNPLKPPEGVLLSQWMKEFSSIFDHAYWLLGGGKHIILKALNAVFTQKQSPRLQDLKFWLKDYAEIKLTPRERNWISTAERPLESLCFKEVGEIFDCNEGVTPSDFFREGQITILELDALDTNDKTFFIEIMMQWIRDWLIAQNKREEIIGTVVLEEAHHVLNREKSRQIGSETVIDLVFREIRELGMGVIYIDQHPSMVSYPALGNTSTHIYMNLGLDTKHSSDIQDATNMLGLNYDEEKNYLRKLPVGHGFVLNRMSMFTEPFLVRFPEFKIKKGSVTDETIREWMQEKAGEEIRNVPPVEKPKEKGQEEDRFQDENLNETAWNIIKVVGGGEGTFTSQIYKNLSMSGSVFKRNIDSLVELGLVRLCNAKIGKNRLIFYFLSDTGQQLFKRHFGEKEVNKSINLEGIKGMFDLAGWKWSEISENRLAIDVDGNKIIIAVEGRANRDGIFKAVKENIYHYITGSIAVRNILLQEAARYCKNEKKNLVVYVSTDEKFEKDGSFEKVELLSDS